jgi:hypothetical protein
MHAALERELPSWGTLQQFVIWGGLQNPPAILLGTIEQDEYTHDVIATLRDGLVLIFGST